MKRLFDICVSFAGLLLLLPLILYVALRVAASSRGPVIYSQERVGKDGKKFLMYKFRSMYNDAELNGPALSRKNDVRITPWGLAMRRWKLDELPQLWNVLKGDMSLVGPRPEREYYIRQIELKALSYAPLLRVRPGITSLGMVRFGYADNLSEMMERMRFDIVYLTERSMTLDIKILAHTLRIILKHKVR